MTFRGAVKVTAHSPFRCIRLNNNSLISSRLRRFHRFLLLIGNYDGASIYYEGLIPSLQRLITSISDPLRKGKWTMVSFVNSAKSLNRKNI